MARLSLEHLAEQRIRQAQANGALGGLAGEGKPLPPDAFEGLQGEALQEALLLRGVGGKPPEVEALRRVAELRAEVATATGLERDRLAAVLARAETEAAMLFERTGRMHLAKAIARG